jgi:Holliday junction DNA helicase RuvA
VITKISGQLAELHEDELALKVGPLEYQVLIPEYTRRRLQGCLNQDISLHTIEYLEGNTMQGRMTPRLVGFLTEVEREFFDLFCSVDGVGARKALRAMVVREETREAEVRPDVVSEAYELLCKLGHSESDARRLLDTALAAKKKYADVQGLLQAIYQQQK